MIEIVAGGGKPGAYDTPSSPDKKKKLMKKVGTALGNDYLCCATTRSPGRCP
jgi:hypothetical protein